MSFQTGQFLFKCQKFKREKKITYLFMNHPLYTGCSQFILYTTGNVNKFKNVTSIFIEYIYFFFLNIYFMIYITSFLFAVKGKFKNRLR